MAGETQSENRAVQDDAPSTADETIDAAAMLADAPSITEVQRRLALHTVRHPTARFANLYPLLSWQPLLHEGLVHLLRARGARTPGPDGIGGAELAAKSDLHRDLLRYFLEQGLYQPGEVRGVRVPKAHGGGTRPLAILNLYDRWVQQLIKLLLDPIYESDFLPQSHGFRLGRSCLTALAHIRHIIETNHPRIQWVIEGDIESCFEQIDHAHLLTLLRERLADERLLRLIASILAIAPADDTSPNAGVLQGGVLSPLLANLYLHCLDKWLAEYAPDCGAVRYADDFVVLSPRSQADTAALITALGAWLRDELALTLSPRKTRLTGVDDGFDFLGYRVQRRRMEWGEEVRYKPSEANYQIARHRISVLTGPRSLGLGAPQLIQRLNHFIRTWSGYFRHSSARLTFCFLGFHAEQCVGKWLLAKRRDLDRQQIVTRFYRQHTWRAGTVNLLELEYMTVGPTRHRIIPHPYIFPPNHLPHPDTYTPPPPLFVTIGEYVAWRAKVAV